MICWRIWTQSLANRLETWGTTRRVFETVMQTGQSQIRLHSGCVHLLMQLSAAAIHCAVLLIIITGDWLNSYIFSVFIDLVSRVSVLMLHAIRTYPDADCLRSSCLCRCEYFRHGGELYNRSPIALTGSRIHRSDCSHSHPQQQVRVSRSLSVASMATQHLSERK